MPQAASSHTSIAIAGLAMVLTMTAVAPTSAQDDAPASMCVLALDELNDVTGLAFTSTEESRGSCTYASDPAVDLYALDLRVDPDGSLDVVRFQYDRGGEDTTVDGLPAWSSDDGLFVDIGGRLLVVQPVFFFSGAAPDPVAVQAVIAALAAPRVGAAVEAAYRAEDSLTARLPTAIAGQPVHPDVMNGADFFRFVDLGTAAIEEVLLGQGLTLADVSVGSFFTGEETEVFALHVPGLDAALLVPAVSGRLAGPGATGMPETRAGREVLAFPDQRMWLYVDGDVLLVISRTDEDTLDAILEALP